MECNNLTFWINLLFGGIGVILLQQIWKAGSFFSRFSIDAPNDEGAVEHRQVVRGTYSHFAKNQDLWIFVATAQTGRYYPQRSPALKDEQGRWVATSYFGRMPSEEIGDEFIVLAITANPPATRGIMDYIIDCLPDEDWPGLSRIPKGCKIKASITVTRK